MTINAVCIDPCTYTPAYIMYKYIDIHFGKALCLTLLESTTAISGISFHTVKTLDSTLLTA